MCGIVGVIDLLKRRRVPDDRTFDAMVDSLAHRGPDGRGVYRSDDVALGHRRLAIIDPTAASDQPFVRDDCALVFNGEIYNFRALRKTLEREGHTFTTRGDTEVLLAAWRQWRERCVLHLDGIFAFVIVHRDGVFAARDHTGIKPLGYRLDDGLLWVASEYKAILRDPRVPRRPNTEALDCFFAHGFIPAPLSPFSSIMQLPPATTMSLSWSQATPVLSTYWRPQARERRVSLDDAAAELRAALDEAVAAQLVSDVPLGAFLSGGLDSASVVAAMRDAGAAVSAFSIGFTDARFDESRDAAVTARILGAAHHVERADLDLVNTARIVANNNDDLLADASSIATFHLSQMTRRHVTVALSGDGADELLGGYPTYIAAALAKPWRLMPTPLRRLARVTAHALPAPTSRYSLRDFALRFLDGAELGESRDFAAFRLSFSASQRRALLTHVDGRPIERYADAVDNADADSALKRLLIADLTHYLPSDMLIKVDRASMHNGLEVRVPFLAPKVIELALSLPSSLLVSKTGETKKVLRRHVAQRVSPTIARGKKRGFSMPIGTSFKDERTGLGASLRDALHDDVVRQGPVDLTVVGQLLREHQRGRADHSHRLYTALVYCWWFKRFIADEALW